MRSKHSRSVSGAFKAMVALSLCAVCMACAGPEHQAFILNDAEFVEPEPLKTEPIDAAYASSLMQWDLMNELLLERKLDPNEAACMDAEYLERKRGDTAEKLKNLKAEQLAKHRVFYKCRAPENFLTRQLSSEAIRVTFSAHLQARRALEEPKAHARTCLIINARKELFQQCMVSNPVLASQQVSWPGWMKLFERYRERFQRPLGSRQEQDQ